MTIAGNLKKIGAVGTGAGAAAAKAAGKSADLAKAAAKKAAENFKKSVDNLSSKFKTLAKESPDELTKATKNIQPSDVKAGLKEAAEQAGKNTDEGKKLLKAADEIDAVNPKTAEALGDNLDQVKNIDGAGKSVFKKLDTAVDNATDFAKKNKKLLIGLAAATTISAIAIAAEVRMNAINNADYKIISIKSDPENNKKTIITFDPSEIIREEDTITLTNTNSTPAIDGSPQFDVINMVSIRVNSPITNEGNSGILKIRTTFGSQFGQIVKEAVDPAIQVASDVTESVADSVFDTIGDILGLPNLGELFSNYWWISLIVIIFSSILR
jgi:hypothetical protein